MTDHRLPRSLRLKSLARLVLLSSAFGAAFPVAAASGVDFAQFDASSESATIVLVKAVQETPAADAPVLVTASFTRWSDGQAGGVGVVKRWSLWTGDHTALLGAGAGANGYRSRAAGDDSSEVGLSLRLQAEAHGAAPGGAYFALVQASSFRNSWFATLQYDPKPLPVAFELSRYGETSYHATTATLRVATGIDRWSLRLGAVRDTSGSRAVIGVGYNGF